MKLIRQSMLCCLVAALTFAGAAQTVPPLINYQGQLTDAAGKPLPTADYVLTFSIYDAREGGNRVWGPQMFDGVGGQGHGPKIPVVQGYFNVMLGPVDQSFRSISAAFDGESRFIEIKVGDNPPIGPRQQVLSAPYAIHSLKADTASMAKNADYAVLATNALGAQNALKLAGFDWSVLLENGALDPSAARLNPGKIPLNAIGSEHLRNSSIGTEDIGDGQVTLAKLAPDASPSPNSLPDASIPTVKLARRAVGASVGLGGFGISARVTYEMDLYDQRSDNDHNAVPGLQVSLTTAGGRPVIVSLVAGDGQEMSAIRAFRPNGNTTGAFMLARDDLYVARFIVRAQPLNASGQVDVPPGCIQFVDFPEAGTHVYKILVDEVDKPSRVGVNNVKLVAYEIF